MSAHHLPITILCYGACSKADDDDDGDRVPDLPRDESAVALNFPLEMSGLETEVVAAAASSGSGASFPPELKALFAYESCAAFLPEIPLTNV